MPVGVAAEAAHDDEDVDAMFPIFSDAEPDANDAEPDENEPDENEPDAAEEGTEPDAAEEICSSRNASVASDDFEAAIGNWKLEIKATGTPKQNQKQ